MGHGIPGTLAFQKGQFVDSRTKFDMTSADMHYQNDEEGIESRESESERGSEVRPLLSLFSAMDMSQLMPRHL